MLIKQDVGNLHGEIDARLFFMICRLGWIAFTVVLLFGVIVLYVSLQRLDSPKYNLEIRVNMGGGDESKYQGEAITYSLPERPDRCMSLNAHSFERTRYFHVLRPYYSSTQLAASNFFYSIDSVLKFNVSSMWLSVSDQQIAAIVDELKLARQDLLNEYNSHLAVAKVRAGVYESTLAWLSSPLVESPIGEREMKELISYLRQDHACAEWEKVVLRDRLRALAAPLPAIEIKPSLLSVRRLHSLIAYCAIIMICATLVGFLVGYGRCLIRVTGSARGGA